MLIFYERVYFNCGNRLWMEKFRVLDSVAHWHLEPELICLTAGRAKVILKGEEHLLTRGQALFCDSGDAHSIATEGEAEIIIFQFSRELYRRVEDFTILPGLNAPIDYNGYYQRIRSEKNGALPFSEQKIELLCADLLYEVFRAGTRAPRAERTDDFASFRVLLEEINARYDTVTFDEACAIMGFSRAYFSKVFKRLAGVNFTDYLNTVRIENAVRMLQTERHKITFVATQCGYSSVRHFNRVFRSVTGFAPHDLPPAFTLDHKRYKTAGETFNPTRPVSEAADA